MKGFRHALVEGPNNVICAHILSPLFPSATKDHNDQITG